MRSFFLTVLVIIYLGVIRSKSSIMSTKHFKVILIFLLFLPSPLVEAGVSDLVVSPATPEQGDEIILLITAQPGENVDVTISFTKNVSVTGGEYNWRLNDVYVPSTPNSVSVVGAGVETLHVSVKILFWITKSAMASGGVAVLSQSNVPIGTYDVWIHGDAAVGVSQVSLLFTAKITIIMGVDGLYEFRYDTDNIPVGNFTVKVGGITKSVTLAERGSTPPPIIVSDSIPPSIIDPSPTGSVNSSTPTISANFFDGSGVNVDSLRLVLNGVDVSESAIVTAESVRCQPGELGNGTTNHVELWISDAYGNEAFLEWDFTILITFLPQILPAEIVVTRLITQPAEVSVGEDVVVTVYVSNVGGQKGTHILTLLLNGESCCEHTISLSAGDSTELNCTLSGLGEGFYNISVEGLSDNFKVSHARADLTVKSVVVSTIESMIYNVKVNVGNVGDKASGPFIVDLRVDSLEIDSIRADSLGPAGTIEFEFKWEPEIHGDYIIETVVDSANDVIEYDESNNREELLFSVDRPKQSQWKYLYIILLVGALCVVFFFRKRLPF